MQFKGNVDFPRTYHVVPGDAPCYFPCQSRRAWLMVHAYAQWAFNRGPVPKGLVLQCPDYSDR